MLFSLYLISVWLHILAAATWLGGISFLVFVLVPWLRKGEPAQVRTVLQETGTRFRTVGWICFVILATTGTFNLWMRGVRLAHFVERDWLTSPFGRTVLVKLVVFVLILATSVAHDFFLGPRALAYAPGSPEALRHRRHASILGRLNALFALLVVALGVAVVRGIP